MDMEAQVREALRSELERQAAEGALTFNATGEGTARVEGDIDLEALAMAVVGPVAGGP